MKIKSKRGSNKMDFSKLIKKLDDGLVLDDTQIVDNTMQITCHKEICETSCPYCGEMSKSVHSTYVRTIKDLPIQEYPVKLKILCHKYFCLNSKCHHKTFGERFSFVEEKAVRTNRLTEYINKIGLRNSSMDTVRDLKDNFINVSVNTVLRILKKEKNK